MTARVVQLLRITPLAYAELVESLKLCGEEGLLRIERDGKHLNVDGLILEVDPYLHSRVFKGPDEYDAWRTERDKLDVWMGGKVPRREDKQ